MLSELAAAKSHNLLVVVKGARTRAESKVRNSSEGLVKYVYEQRESGLGIVRIESAYEKNLNPTY